MQLVQNITADSLRSRSGEGDNRHSRKSFSEHAQFFIIWSKVMAPLAHAMYLVDDESGEFTIAVEPQQAITEFRRLGYLFRSYIEQFQI